MRNNRQVDTAGEHAYGENVSGIYTQAKRNKVLRDAGLLEDHSDLANAIQIAVIHGIYVLYKREKSSYYFVDMTNDEAKILKVLENADKLGVDKLVDIVESLLGEVTRHVRF